MAQNISATNAFTTNYDTGVPEQTDDANIVQAFTDYHYGADYNGAGAPGGIEGHLTDIAADIVTHANLSTGVHGVSGNVVGTTSTQTLTNKTITGGTVNPTTLQQGGIQAVTVSDTQTLTNKTITSPTISGATITSPTITVATTTASASYTLLLTDGGKLVEMTSATANNLTIPLSASAAFTIGTSIFVLQAGAGQTTIVPTAGVTINSFIGLKIIGQWSGCTLIKRGTNTWVAIGGLVA
jgi:hypothetical protein